MPTLAAPARALWSKGLLRWPLALAVAGLALLGTRLAGTEQGLLGALVLVALCTWWCGRAPGALAALVCAAGVLMPLLPYTPRPGEVFWRIGTFLAAGMALALLVGRLERLRGQAVQRAQQAEALLEQVRSLNTELQHTQEQFELFVRRSPALMWLKDAQGRYVLINEAGARCAGHDDPQAMRGLTDADLWPRELAQHIHAQDERARQHGDSLTDDLPFEHGGRRYAVSRFPVRLRDGTVGIGGTAVDITLEWTARQAAEDALAESKAQQAVIRAVMDYLPEGITLAWGHDGCIAAVSRHGLQLIKKSAEAVVGVEAQDHPGTWEVYTADGRTLVEWDALPLTRACRGQETQNQELLVRAADGELIPILCDAGPVRDDAGNPIGGIIAWRDIRPLKAQQRAHSTATAQLDAMLNNTPLGVVMWDADFRITRWAGQSRAIFGYEAGEMVGRALDNCGLVPDPEQARVQDVRQELKRTNTFVVSRNRNLTRDGRLITCEWYNSVVLDEAGHTQAVLSLVLDVTQRELHAAQLLEADRRKDAFLATLAHELRNPLAPIRNIAQLLSQDTQPQVRERAVGILRRQVAQMARLLDDLLDISRLTLNRLELRRASVELRDVVDEALEQSRPLLDAAHQTVTLEIGGTSPLLVDGDRARLAQALANLLNNAARYCRGPGSVHIKVASESVSGVHVVSVADEGMGIDAHQLERIFDMLAQGHPQHEASIAGLGIGLALARGLVRLHGGDIQAHSDGPGLGAIFTIRLPALAQSPQAMDALEQPLPHAPQGTRVLIVDDNRDQADTLALMLAPLGYETCVVYGGHEALRVAPDFRPSLVLLDIGLPDMSGLEVARALRAGEQSHGIGLIALSGWGQTEDKQRAHDAGFDAHVTKPASPGELGSVLAGVLAAIGSETPGA